MDDDGVVFFDYFSPIPIELIGLALTVVRFEASPLTLDADGLYLLLSDRVLHLRVV